MSRLTFFNDNDQKSNKKRNKPIYTTRNSRGFESTIQDMESAVVYQKPKLSAKTESFRLSISAAESKG